MTVSQISTKQDKLTFDSVPTEGSSNPVTSGGVYTAINTIQTTNPRAVLFANGFVKGDLDNSISGYNSTQYYFSAYENKIVETPNGCYIFRTFSTSERGSSKATEYTSENRVDKLEEIVRKIFGNTLLDGTYTVSYYITSTDCTLNTSQQIKFSVESNIITPISMGIIGALGSSTKYMMWITNIEVTD